MACDPARLADSHGSKSAVQSAATRWGIKRIVKTQKVMDWHKLITNINMVMDVCHTRWNATSRLKSSADMWVFKAFDSICTLKEGASINNHVKGNQFMTGFDKKDRHIGD